MFTGQQYDDETGLYFLRARFYDPGVGRFLSEDPYPINTGDPTELNRYLYVANNAPNWVDPSGKQSLAKYVIVATTIIAVAASAAAIWAPPENFQELISFLRDLIPWVEDDDSNGNSGNSNGGNNTPPPNTPAPTPDYPSPAPTDDDDGITRNRKGDPYPQIIDLKTGEPIIYPGGEFVEASERTPRNENQRGDFIVEWYDNGYETPPGGWKLYQIHHIQPLSFGGNNDFENLTPVLIDDHKLFTKWWRDNEPEKKK